MSLFSISNSTLTHARSTKAIFTLALLIFPSFLLAMDADWPHYRGPAYDGLPKATIQPNNLKLAWEAEIGTGFSGITVADGRVFSMGNQSHTDSVICLDEKTGKVLWRHSYPSPLDPNLYEGGPNATPTISQGKVYTLSRKGHIFCLDAKSGKVLWKAHAKDFNASPPQWGFSGSPTIFGDRVLFNIGSHGVALNKDSGKILWKSSGGSAGYASPIPFQHKGKQAIALFSGKSFKAISPDNGKVLISYDWRTSYDVNAASPLFFDNKVFLSSGYNTGCLLLDLSEKPKPLWQNKNLRNQFSSSVFYKGYIYGIDGDSRTRAKLVCLDPKTGEVAWSKGLGFGTLTIAGSTLLMLNDRGTLFMAEASPKAYRELGKRDILEYKCWTVPTLANGKLFARNAYGSLVAMDLGPQ